VIYGSLETLSGGYLYDRNLVKHLQSKGDQVEVISLSWRNYPLHLMDNFSSHFHNTLEQLQVDILLQDELNHPSLFLLNRSVKEKLDIPIISIVHHLRSSEGHPNWQNIIYQIVEKRYLKDVDGFIFNSNSTREVVEGLVGEKKVSVVAYPAGDRLNPEISADTIRTRSIREGPLRLLFLGNLISRKGLLLLLDALAGIQMDEWRLSVVGSLEMDRLYVKRIMSTIQQRGLLDRIEFMGQLVEDELNQVMEDSHAMVMPSIYEGFGIAYLEGMGFGLPAIASTAGGAAEIITPGVDGFLVPPDNAILLRDHLMGLITDRGLLASMSLAALERYRSHPTWEDTTSRIRDFLVSMLNLGCSHDL
jgi:glycosyltransferase involved in cell wall biosynthesis